MKTLYSKLSVLLHPSSFSEEWNDPDINNEFNGEITNKKGESKSRYDRDAKKPEEVENYFFFKRNNLLRMTFSALLNKVKVSNLLRLNHGWQI